MEKDFITVKKEKDLNWEDLKHGIISEINDYYSKGNEVVVSKDLKLEKILSESLQTLNQFNQMK